MVNLNNSKLLNIDTTVQKSNMLGGKFTKTNSRNLSLFLRSQNIVQCKGGQADTSPPIVQCTYSFFGDVPFLNPPPPHVTQRHYLANPPSL